MPMQSFFPAFQTPPLSPSLDFFGSFSLPSSAAASPSLSFASTVDTDNSFYIVEEAECVEDPGKIDSSGACDAAWSKFGSEGDKNQQEPKNFTTSPAFFHPSLPPLLQDPRTILIPAASPEPVHLKPVADHLWRIKEVESTADGMDEEEATSRRRKERRKLTNRNSAKNFRERRRFEQERLEATLSARDREIDHLGREAERLRVENLGLRYK